MADSSIPSKKARLHSDEETNKNRSDIPNSSISDRLSSDNVDSTFDFQNLPDSISKWTESDIQSFISISYDENMTPLELINKFQTQTKNQITQMDENVCKLEKFFKHHCLFHQCLHEEFDSLEVGTAKQMRGNGQFTTSFFLERSDTRPSDALVHWLRR